MDERETGAVEGASLANFSRETVEEAVRDADLRVLLMSIFHLTGDRKWLEPPYRPVRDVRLIAEPSAGLPPEIQDDVRRSAVELLLDRQVGPAIANPDDTLLAEMMSFCLGEDVPPEYVPMMRQEMGFAPSLIERDQERDVSGDERVLIVGAGLSGLALAAQLVRLQIPFTIVEKNADLGGTWYENQYPGAGVDTPNHAYSYSYGPRYRWTRYFSLRGEIFEYISQCADSFGVRDHIRFDTEVVSADWSSSSNQWEVRLRSGDGSESTASARFLVSAVGLLNVPSTPQIPGLADFSGPIFHSARWDHDVDLAHQRVAIVGTGATAMQIVPSIADSVESLTIYQRSPQWARPIGGYRDDIPAGGQWLLENVPFYAEWFRFTMFYRYGDALLKTLRKDPSWPHPERAVNKRNDLHREELTNYIHEELSGRPDLIAKAVPNYPPFGKRILIDNGWFQALQKPNVELVTEDIECIEQRSILTSDGEKRESDVVILATGFKVTELTARLNVRGRGGLSLADAWANDNPTAYLGITVPGFPNLFCMQGPNSGLAHGGSAIFQAECQARYIAKSIVELGRNGAKSMEVRAEVHDNYMNEVDAEHEQLIWTHGGMSNWYRNARGRVVAVMPWRLVDYWHMTKEPKLEEYILRS